MSSFIDGLFSRGPIPVLERQVLFTEARHKYLVGNVANAETPGYRRQDLSADAFQRELGRAIDDRRRQAGVELGFDARQGIRSRDPVGTRLRILGGGRLAERGVLRHDGNDVDIEREMALLQQNSGRLRRNANLLKKYLGMIRAAATESPR